MRNVLLTGSEGYIGSILCEKLRENGLGVVEFDKVLGNDITDFKDIFPLSKDVDVIVHLAAIVGMESVDQNKDLSYRINVHGTENVLRCGKKTIYASVLAGYDGYDNVTEETPVVAKNAYYLQKMEAEKKISCFDSNVVLRFGSLYGVSRKMRDDLLVHNLVRESLNGGINLFQPDFMRPITCLSDAVGAIMFFCTSGNGGGIYNIVSNNISKREIAETICEVNGSPMNIIEDTDSENRNYVVSTEKIRSMGFEFQSRHFQRDISEISEYYRKGYCE